MISFSASPFFLLSPAQLPQVEESDPAVEIYREAREVLNRRDLIDRLIQAPASLQQVAQEIKEEQDKFGEASKALQVAKHLEPTWIEKNIFMILL